MVRSTAECQQQEGANDEVIIGDHSGGGVRDEETEHENQHSLRKQQQDPENAVVLHLGLGDVCVRTYVHGLPVMIIFI